MLARAKLRDATLIRVLILEDNPSDAELMVRALEQAGFDPKWERVETERDFAARLTPELDLILSDYALPQFSGPQALQLVRSRGLDVPFILVSGSIGEDIAVAAMREGADDYLLKDRMARLGAAVQRAIERRNSRAEQQRVLAETARLAAIVENSYDAIVGRDLDGTITSWNAGAERMFGYTAAETIGRPITLLMSPGLPSRLESNTDTVRSGKLVAPFETQRAARDGRILDVLVSVSPVKDPDGRVTGASAIFHDITELKRAEAAMRGSEERFRAAFEQAGVGMALRGIDPRNSRWLRVNQKLCDILGYTRAELLQLTSVEITPPEDRDLAVEYNEKLLKGEITNYAREKRYMRKDGRIIWANITLTAVSGPDGLKSHIISVIEDITERKEAGEKIVRLNRVLAVLSEINSAIVRIRNRQELFDEACRIAVEYGGFGLAWIGLFDPATLDVTPVASAGLGSDEMRQSIATVRADMPQGQGVLGRAIRERKPMFDNDISVETSVGGKRRQEALRLGYRSLIVLPLFAEGVVAGMLALFAREPGFFTEEEIKLLTELAGNISFSLEHMARQEKIEKLSRIRAVLGEINAAIARIRSKQELFDEACRIMVMHGKFVMAWIGMLDEATQELSPLAKAGREEGYLERIRLTIDPNTSKNLALAVEAMARQAPVVCNDIANDGRMRAWRAAALDRGYRSAALLPLLQEQKAVGVIALYAPEPGFFDEEEVKLLVEMVGDMAFALQSIARQEKVDYLSYYDALTGLPNRTLFQERLGHQLRIAKQNNTKVALVVGDVKRFRFINESLGRQAGDALLREIAVRSKSAWPDPNNLARIAADSFAGILAGLKDEAEIVHVLEKLLAEVTDLPFNVGEKELKISVTASIAVFPVDGVDADTLFANAEAALKRAKVSGERYLFYQPAMNATVAQTLLLENKMRRALDKEQFVLHYQPKVELASGRICGLEALIRWNDPDTGLVPPMKFIPLLEETGMILDVGRWAIHKALEDYREWHARGLQPPRIAVNVSPIQLRQKDFVDVVRDAIGSAAAGSHGLDLEITESLIMEDIEGNIAKLRAVRDMGVNISIDDFGTGYSSLGYLAKLPVNTLKIDRSFIITMAKEPDSMTIVSTIISLAHSLNLKVVAEGVDAEEQRKFLRLLKCDEMQGYLFSKPLPADALVALLRGALPVK